MRKVRKSYQQVENNIIFRAARRLVIWVYLKPDLWKTSHSPLSDIKYMTEISYICKY